MSSASISKIFQVSDSENLLELEVNIGFAQIAASRLSFNYQPFGKENYEGSFKETLGKNKDLRGKIFICNTTVTDRNPDTNETSIQLKLNGGSAPFSVEIKENSGANGNNVQYSITIYFY